MRTDRTLGAEVDALANEIAVARLAIAGDKSLDRDQSDALVPALDSLERTEDRMRDLAVRLTEAEIAAARVTLGETG